MDPKVNRLTELLHPPERNAPRVAKVDGSRKTRTKRGLAACAGEFGRLLVLANTAPMVAHAHEDFNVIVHRDGPAVPWRVGGRELLLEASHALIVRPWEVHERLAGANQPSV